MSFFLDNFGWGSKFFTLRAEISRGDMRDLCSFDFKNLISLKMKIYWQIKFQIVFKFFLFLHIN